MERLKGLKIAILVKFTDWGDEFPVDVSLTRAAPESYDALLLPGGVMNPDRL